MGRQAPSRRCPDTMTAGWGGSVTVVGMGLVSKIVKLGIAKKVYDEARKPENQRRAKEAYASFQAKRAGKR